MNHAKKSETRSKISFSLIQIDLDNFKHINDRYGHAMGDCLLQAISQLMQMDIRDYDQLFRIGGDEFVILLNACSFEKALISAQNICVRLNQHVFVVENKKHHITASMGVVDSKQDPDPTRLLLAADEALYRAKQKGKNCASV